MSSIKHIVFDQSIDVINKLDSQIHTTLLDINKEFGGLCELICNCILIDNLLGDEKSQNALRDRITVERMNTDDIKTSHLLNVYSIFCKAIAYLFGIYPDNILSFMDQWKLVKDTSVNSEILNKGLSNIKQGETLKLEVFRKSFLGFAGHSLLIKKISNENYIFFDPNKGEYRGLSFDELSDHIDEQLKKWNGTDLFMTQGDIYLNKIKKS